MSASLKNKRVKRKSKWENEIVVLEKSEKVNFYVNKTNSFFASESLCVQNFEESSKDEEGKLTYKSIKTIYNFPSDPYFILWAAMVIFQFEDLSTRSASNLVLRGTQISYSAAVDLVAELGVSQVTCFETCSSIKRFRRTYGIKGKTQMTGGV
ncbi:hypothetical protein M9H77_04251 [Catharanthus roseus]|uniref:Uncharacterized protein n=1 Tax=Catharanthus roseus TaxID=4058 RepID=A0ACC0CE41_CATRO|nr:hypothetical protein M9H77_04251 [Catharanthus roseus]